MASHDHDHNDGSDLSEMELRMRALETILVEKGYVETAAMRPAETDGWSEAQLAALVTRDCMIGTGLPKKPSEVA